MLVLSRKVNESIVIDNNVTITVIDVTNGKVRLGIAAPQQIPIHRQEVFEAIHGQPPNPEPKQRVHENCPTCTCKKTA